MLFIKSKRGISIFKIKIHSRTNFDYFKKVYF